MAKQQERLTVPVNLKIKQSTLDVFSKEAGGVSASDVLGPRASAMLDTAAEGGMMLSGNDVEEISTHYSSPVMSSKDVVKATEPRASKRDGQTLISFTIDPANVSLLEESAQMGGKTLDEHMRDVIAMAMDNGWIGEVPPLGTRRIFTPEQETWFSLEMGLSDFTVSELQKHIKALKKSKAVELDAPVLTEAV